MFIYAFLLPKEIRFDRFNWWNFDFFSFLYILYLNYFAWSKLYNLGKKSFLLCDLKRDLLKRKKKIGIQAYNTLNEMRN